jgi:hypothetical protein
VWAKPAVEQLEERSLFDTGLSQIASAQFVTGLYYDLLHRQPHQAGVASWTSALVSGATRQTVISDFVHSPEYETNVIRHDYETVLGRDTDPDGLTHWLGLMNSGLTEQQLLADLAGSDEAYVHNGGTPASWLVGLYEDLLGRAPGTLEMNGWLMKMRQGMARNAVARDFVYGPEEDALQVTAIYRDLLGRNPDAWGMAGSVAAMEHGLTTEQLIVAVASSPEYIAQQINTNLALAVSSKFDANGSPTPGPGVAVALQGPDFTTSVNPAVTINVGTPNFAGRVRIDVAGSRGTVQNQTTGIVTPLMNTLTLNALPRDKYQVSARIVDQFGNEIASQPITVVVDPDAGFVGSSHLLTLYTDYMSALTIAQASGKGTPDPSFFAGQSKLFMFDDQQRVKVNVHPTLRKDLKTLQAGLVSWGMAVTQVTPSQNMVTGYLPIARIKDLPLLANFASVTPVYAPIRSVGSATTQGDAVIRADSFRNTFGVTGQGVTVGALSDTVNQVNGGIADSQATGDLPAQGVLVLEDGASKGATDEGRAMLEIVHDIAPGATLAFHTATNSPQDFADGIQALASAGAKVEVDDIAWLDSPFFNDGVIAQAVDHVAAQGVFYASAAGNEGHQGFFAGWNGVTATVDGTTGTFFNVGGGSPLQTFTLQPGQSFQLDFQWDDAFLEGGSSQPNFQVPTEIDVLVTTADGQRVLQQFNDNTLNTNEAVQVGTFGNDGSFGTNQFALAFVLKQGPAPKVIRWVAFGDDPQAHGEGAPTIFGQAAAAGAMAVGAVPWNSPSTPEFFTSQGGPVPFLFDSQGNRLATPEIRNKPDITAPDGVDTSFFGSPAPQGDPDQHPRFFGTSAAAPHVAGAAALLLQQFPSATNAVLFQHMQQTALDVDSPGPDSFTGPGLIQLVPISGPGGGGGSGGGGGGSASGPASMGDPFQSNDSSDQAADLGLFSGGIERFLNLDILNHPDGLADYDWFQWTMGLSGTFTASIVYQASGDLHLRVFVLDDNGMLVQLGAGVNIGATSQHVSVPVLAGQQIFVWVYGLNNAQGVYDMQVGVG